MLTLAHDEYIAPPENAAELFLNVESVMLRQPPISAMPPPNLDAQSVKLQLKTLIYWVTPSAHESKSK